MNNDKPGSMKDLDSSLPASDGQPRRRAGITRRTFLGSLGALALSACGGAEDDADAASLRSAGDAATRAAAAAEPVSGPAFVHPGLLHTEADFARMRDKVKASAQPWLSGWNVLASNGLTSLSRGPDPQPVIYRGNDGVHGENYPILYRDVAATYACALRWKVSGDSAYADKAVQYLNAWSSTLTALGGDSNAALAAGIYGYEFANAAEIMRGYSGWAATDLARFQAMMRKVFYPINHDFLVRHNNTQVTHYWANWDLCNMASIMAIGVLCDDRALFDEAVEYFRHGAGNGAMSQAVYYLHPGYLGQWQETGRDQGHNTLGIALGGAICEMAWNQGVDLYGYDNNRFLAGAEYVAKANLIESDTSYYSVPYVPYRNIDVSQPVFSSVGQGTIRPCWALVYNHYVNRKGMAAPFSQLFASRIAPEGGGGNYGPNSGGFDQLGYGTLTCTLDPVASGAAPTGLSAVVGNGEVVLSWWGTAYATEYRVKRATTAGGPYATVATVAAGVSGPGTTYTDTGLPAGTYYYVVSAAAPSGESADSAEVRAIAAVVPHLYLPFDKAAGMTAADVSGNRNDGTLVNGVGRTGGRMGNALSFDGVDDYVALPEDLMAGIGDFTVATWVYWNAVRANERVFDFGSGTGRYMMLSPRGAGGRARFVITVNGYPGEMSVEHAGALPAGRWVHVAVTLSGRTASLYLDGVLTGTNPAMWLAPFQLGNTTQNWIGRSQFSADPGFNGRIDDFRIYRGALDASAIAALAQG